MKYVKTFEVLIYGIEKPFVPVKQKVDKMPHFSDEYYVNNCAICNQIMTVKAGEKEHYSYLTYDELMQKKFEHLIKHIKESPNKAITFGNRTNATSVKISKEQYDILVSEFPDRSNIK